MADRQPALCICIYLKMLVFSVFRSYRIRHYQNRKDDLEYIKEDLWFCRE